MLLAMVSRISCACFVLIGFTTLPLGVTAVVSVRRFVSFVFDTPLSLHTTSDAAYG
jgi:hypothetical protein